MNKVEETRLEKLQRIIAKEQRFRNNVQSKVIERTNKTLKEKQALVQLLSHDYKFDNFVTMQRGFDPNQIDSKHVARRYVMESRVFNSGFNMTALRPEVHRRLRKLDPNHKYHVFKKKLLAENRERNVEINRAISNSAFRLMLHDRENWREYNDPKARPKPKKREDQLTDTPVLEFVQNVDFRPENIPVTEASNEESVDVTTEDHGHLKEKSIVLERRLPRRPVESFGMTTRTLGPVYFQAPVSVNTEIQDVKA